MLNQTLKPPVQTDVQHFQDVEGVLKASAIKLTSLSSVNATHHSIFPLFWKMSRAAGRLRLAFVAWTNSTRAKVPFINVFQVFCHMVFIEWWTDVAMFNFMPTIYFLRSTFAQYLYNFCWTYVSHLKVWQLFKRTSNLGVVKPLCWGDAVAYGA